jgi:hypothetical protein
MSRKKTSAKVVLPGITPSNQGEMGAVLLGFASALMSNSSMEDAYEKAPATASGAAEESPVKKQRKTPANYFIFPGDRRITGQHVVQLRQAIRVFSACADNWEISRHLQGLAALAQNQLKDADVKKIRCFSSEALCADWHSGHSNCIPARRGHARRRVPHAGGPGPIGLRR